MLVCFVGDRTYFGLTLKLCFTSHSTHNWLSVLGLLGLITGVIARKLSVLWYGCSARVKRTLFSAKSARTLRHFII